MLTIKYCQEGEIVSDFMAETWVKNIIQKYKQEKMDKVIQISNEIPLDLFCLFTMQGLLDYNEIKIYYCDKLCEINPYMGLCFVNEEEAIESHYAYYSNEILKIGYNNIKKNKEKFNET